MKITSKVLANFNLGKLPSFNEAVNVRDNLPTREQYAFLKQIQRSEFGIMNGKVTQKHIKLYSED
jgi:hypothetical protein